MNFFDFTIDTQNPLSFNTYTHRVHLGFGIFQEIEMYTPWAKPEDQRGFCTSSFLTEGPTTRYIYDEAISNYRNLNEHDRLIVDFTPPSFREYTAICTHVADGDTVDCLITVGPYLKILKRCRLARIDAPELNRAKEYASAFIAKRVLEREILNEQITLKIELYHKGDRKGQEKEGKYGRLLIDIFKDGISINDYMILNGYATPYNI